MIDQESQQSLIGIVESALRDNLQSDIKIVPCDEKSIFKSDEVILITISSYKFQFILFFHYVLNNDLEQYIARKLNIERDKISLQQCKDFLSEFCNGYCGQIKRAVGAQYEHLGMSTPNRLDEGCVNYIDALNCGCKHHLEITLEGDIKLYLSLCLSTSGNFNFVIHCQQHTEEDVDHGELEFF